MLPLVITYILSCLVVALFGTNRKFGFWGYFFAAMALTPLVGIFIVLASDPRKNLNEKSK